MRVLGMVAGGGRDGGGYGRAKTLIYPRAEGLGAFFLDLARPISDSETIMSRSKDEAEGRIRIWRIGRVQLYNGCDLGRSELRRVESEKYLTRRDASLGD